MSDLVSVIIPAYNCGLFISETIESVLRQTHTNFEVIIVDDGSTDNLADVIDKYLGKDTRIQLLRQSNRGVSSARNNGFGTSKGDYVAFLDADDLWLPDNLALKVKVLQGSTAGLVHSDGEVIDANSKPSGTLLKGTEGNVLSELLLWRGTQIPGPSSVLVRRKVLEEVGLFDENLSTAADKDLFIRIAARYAIARVADVTWRYRIHNNNMHRNISAMESDMIDIYGKARNAGLFGTRSFERKCYAAMYLVLAASWAVDGNNGRKGFLYLMKAIYKDPFVIFNVLQRIFNRFINN